MGAKLFSSPTHLQVDVGSGPHLIPLREPLGGLASDADILYHPLRRVKTFLLHVELISLTRLRRLLVAAELGESVEIIWVRLHFELLGLQLIRHLFCC